VNRYRKPRIWRTQAWGGSVVGEPLYIPDKVVRRRNTALRNAKKLRRKPTSAEARLEAILNELNNGVLKDKFFTQWAFADKWILDFFFYENRLGIEVDGGIHDHPIQIRKDRAKEKACSEWDITLIRLKNQEVFGNREKLINKLRKGWRKANTKIKGSPFAMQPNISNKTPKPTQ